MGLNGLKSFVVKNLPAILTGVGVIAGGVGVGLAIDGVRKANHEDISDKVESKIHDLIDDYPDMPNNEINARAMWEKVKLYAPYFAAPIGFLAAGVGCFIAADRIHVKRAAVLTAAYEMSDKAFGHLYEKTREKLGDGKFLELREEMAEEKARETEYDEEKVVLTGRGDTLCYDTMSGRYFRSDISDVRRAENELVKRLADEVYLSLNDFYELLGLPDIKLGNYLGWDANDLYPDVTFSSMLDDFGDPALVMDISALGILPGRNQVLTNGYLTK